MDSVSLSRKIMSFKKEVVKGVFWIAVAKYSGLFVSLIITAILARLISPDAFGTVAVALVILHFLNILADIGIGPAVVQYKDLSKSNLNDIFTFSFLLGGVLCVLLYISAPLIASFYKKDTLIPICKLLCIVIFFNAINVVPNGIMRREKKFKTIALRTLSFQIVGGGLAIWAAYKGWGVYALLISSLVSSIGVFIVNYYFYPLKINYRFKKHSLDTIFSFSIFQFLYSFINYFSRNLDKLIIGRRLSLSELGYYDKSYHLMMLPVQYITNVVEPVLHPILADYRTNKNDIKEKNLKLTKIVSYISFPIGLLLFFCGGELINIVYGRDWTNSIPTFKILALSLPLQVVISTIAPMYQSIEKTKLMFWVGLLNSSITIGGFFLASICFNSIEAIAWSWDITLVINFINSYFILHHWGFHESSKPFFQQLVPQIVNSFLVFSICFFLFNWISISSDILSLMIKIIIVPFMTFLFAFILKQYNIIHVLSRYKDIRTVLHK